MSPTFSAEYNLVFHQLESQRYAWLDLLKGICALFVILVHTQKPEAYAFLFRPFFLMCFFFASGYTERRKDHFIQKEFIRTIKILVVAECVRIIYFAISQGQFVGWGQVWSVFYQNYAQYPTYTPLIWFIPCICIAKILFQLILRVSKENYFAILFLSFSAGTVGLLYCAYVKHFLPWHIHTSFLAQYFFFMGYTIRVKAAQFEQFENLLLGFFSIFYFVLICRGPFAGDLALLKVSDWSRYMTTAVLGTLMMVLLCQKAEKHASEAFPSFLIFVGKNSLFFFAFQSYFINMGNSMMKKIGFLEEKPIASLLVTFISAACLTALCLIRDSFFNHINSKYRLSLRPII